VTRERRSHLPMPKDDGTCRICGLRVTRDGLRHLSVEAHGGKRAAAAKYAPAPKDDLATVQHLIILRDRGELNGRTITDEQRRMARLYFDVTL
jgi:hypothetical protein